MRFSQLVNSCRKRGGEEGRGARQCVYGLDWKVRREGRAWESSIDSTPPTPAVGAEASCSGRRSTVVSWPTPESPLLRGEGGIPGCGYDVISPHQ